MAFKCVSRITNSLNTYKFAVFPLNGYSGHTGSLPYTSYTLGGYRSNPTQFNYAIAEINNILSQGTHKRGKFSFSAGDYSNVDQYVYGNSGGNAIHVTETITESSLSASYLRSVYKLVNFASSPIYGKAGGYSGMGDAKTQVNCSVFGLVCNEDTQEIYFADILLTRRYYVDPSTPDDNDLAFLDVAIYDDAACNLWDVFMGSIPTSEDPYHSGGTSTTGGGENATYDDTSDEIDVPSIPLLNLTFSGFMSAYAPTLTQVQDLATYVWSDWDTGNYLNKLFANVADAIISLHMLPFSPSASTTPADVMVGKYDSGVDMYPLNAQFNDIDCGTLAIPLYWDNYLDFNPYTKLTLFLPYVGEVTLNPDEVMGHTIGIKYRVDALTGAFVCFITRSDHKIVGQYQGNCALSVPLSSANYAQLHAAMLTIATAAVGAAAATGGAVAGLAAGGEAGIEAALGVMDTKVKHNVSGALGSAAGFMGSQKPYLIIERARQCLPEDLGQFAGYPSQITETLGSLSGFTQVADIILDGLPLTEAELEELRGILSEGVIL